MTKQPINMSTKPKWLSEKYLNTLDEKFRAVYNDTRKRFRIAWANGQKEKAAGLVGGDASPSTKKTYTGLGNWLIIVYDVLNGAHKLDTAAREKLEKKVYAWAETNKPATFTEDIKEWEFNNKFFNKGSEDPLSRITEYL